MLGNILQMPYAVLSTERIVAGSIHELPVALGWLSNQLSSAITETAVTLLTSSRCSLRWCETTSINISLQHHSCCLCTGLSTAAGHARVYVAFDVLYRLLRQLQYDVQYVRNFTDVDDKIIKRAAESGEEPLALAGRFITEFHADMAALGCLPPTVSCSCDNCNTARGTVHSVQQHLS
jgi:hypothetical protein